MQKISQITFTVDKVIKRKDDNLHIKWKGYANSLTVGLIKKILLCRMSYFPEPHTCNKKIKVELDFPNYATKYDLKIATSVDTSKFAKNTDLAGLKSDANK